jgi:MFS family permease
MTVTPVDSTGARLATRRQAVTLMLVASLPTMAIAGLIPVLPALFGHFRDAPHAEWLVPMILTMPSLCVALFSSPIGAAADRFGRRPILLVALVVFSVCGLLPLVFDGLYAVIASRVLVGLAEGALLTVGNALLGDYFDGVERKRWLGLQTAIGPFVGTAYVLAGGFLGTWSWKGPFLLYALGLVFLIPAALTLYEPPSARDRATVDSPPAGPFPWRTALQVGGVTLLFSIPFFVQNVQHGRILGDLGLTSSATIGWVVALASMGTVIGGWLFRSVPSRPVGTLLAWAFLAYGLCYVGLAVAPNVIVGFPFSTLGQFAGGFGLPVLIAWVLTRYAPEQRGRGMGLWASCLFLGQFVSAPVMTTIAHGRLTFLQSIGVLGVGCLLAAAVAWSRGRRAARVMPA